MSYEFDADRMYRTDEGYMVREAVRQHILNYTSRMRNCPPGDVRMEAEDLADTLIAIVTKSEAFFPTR